MKIPIFLILFIFLCIYVKCKIIKSDKECEKQTKAFWNKEEKAMFVRKKDIENLNYIYVDKNSLPILEENDCSNEILELQDKVLELLEHKMLNFNGKTNTELKLEYGTANLDTLITYENNYNMLIKYLYAWGKLLHENNNINDAIKVLEVGVNINTDISNHYILLGNLYKTKKDTKSFDSLYNYVNQTSFVLKDKILKALSS